MPELGFDELSLEFFVSREAMLHQLRSTIRHEGFHQRHDVACQFFLIGVRDARGTWAGDDIVNCEGFSDVREDWQQLSRGGGTTCDVSRDDAGTGSGADCGTVAAKLSMASAVLGSPLRGSGGALFCFCLLAAGSTMLDKPKLMMKQKRGQNCCQMMLMLLLLLRLLL